MKLCTMRATYTQHSDARISQDTHSPDPVSAKVTHFKIHTVISCINDLSTQFRNLIPINILEGKSKIKQHGLTGRSSYSQ